MLKGTRACDQLCAHQRVGVQELRGAEDREGPPLAVTFRSPGPLRGPDDQLPGSPPPKVTKVAKVTKAKRVLANQSSSGPREGHFVGSERGLCHLRSREVNSIRILGTIRPSAFSAHAHFWSLLVTLGARSVSSRSVRRCDNAFENKKKNIPALSSSDWSIVRICPRFLRPIGP
eukprot:5778195-Pyramimonas_sp.AAC.1